MNVIRVFPQKTSATPCDEHAFVGDPPLMRPDADEVHVSCTFTWDKPRAERLALAWGQFYPVRLGGPAYNDRCNGFTPGLYVRQGIVFTSRGCNNHCPWCLVPQREGKLRELDAQPGNIIQDNNLLQCSKAHISRVFDMLRTQHGIQFTGGLDARLITDEIADDLRGLRIKQLFLACDTEGSLNALAVAAQRLQMPRNRVRCYVLIGYNGETMDTAEGRLRAVYEVGCLPFAQLYQPPDKRVTYSVEWRHLARTWSRPAAMKTVMARTR